MADPFIGEVKFFGFGFAPLTWGLCNGAKIAIRQQTSLYALIGTQFGGDGVSTFQLPNLASRVIVGSGQGPGLSGRTVGSAFGTSEVTLQTANLPPHQHTFQAFANPDVSNTNVPSASSALSICSDAQTYVNAPPDASFNPNAVSSVGGGQAHGNLQPTLGLTPCMAMVGTWPEWD